MKLRPEEAMLEIDTEEVFNFYKENLSLGIIERPQHIAVYTKNIEPRRIIDGSELAHPFSSKVIIGPNEGSLATWIEPEEFMKKYDKDQFGELSKIYPGHLSGVMLFELVLGYQDRDVPTRTMIEHRSVYVHSNSDTLPRDLEYKLFDFQKL